MNANIKPIPDAYGVGFTCYNPSQEDHNNFCEAGYEHKLVGINHNYLFTAKVHTWPLSYPLDSQKVIDAFAPNMNKQLHVGHLRNLAIAKSLSSLLPNATFVAMLGHSLGVIDSSVEALHGWFDFLNYHPKTYVDIELNVNNLPQASAFVPGTGEYEGSLVWNGLQSPVVVKRKDGSSTYALHDMAFAASVSPTHYLTGAEQHSHFANLGFGDKHLAMGLVLDPVTKKKMKSRTGDALLATEAVEMVVANLEPDTKNAKELAWNILCWNFLHAARASNMPFDPASWTKPQSPGMYVTYTYARIASALSKISTNETEGDLTPSDVALIGYANYLPYYQNKAVQSLDPAPVANYAHDLARKLGTMYQTGESIKDGRFGYVKAVKTAFETLGKAMSLLGMFKLDYV